MTPNLSQQSPRPESIQGRPPLFAIWVSLLACVPFALLQIAFIADSYSWSVVLFGYGGIFLYAPVVFLGWIIYCGSESFLRTRAEITGAPVFSLVAAPLLLAFFLPAISVHYIVATMPSFRRVTQSVEWKTSKGSFVLALTGKGTPEKHHFSSGYINWTGKGNAGFSSIQLDPITLQDDYCLPHHQGTRDELQEGLAASGISQAELDAVGSEIWNILNSASRGEDINAEVGIVAEVWSAVDEIWDATIAAVGGFVWILLLVLAFQIAGHFTLRRLSENNGSRWSR